MDNSVMNFPDATYVFTWGGIEAKAGGMTRAMLRQLNTLLKYRKKCIVLCCAKNIEQLDSPQYYKKNGYPHINESNFLTITQFLESKFDVCGGENEKLCFPNIFKMPREEKEDKILYYHNGELFAIGKIKEKNERKQVVRLCNCENRTIDIVYWEGILRRVVEYQDNKKNTKYYSKSKKCILNINAIKNKQGEWEEYEIVIFDYLDEKAIHFSGKNELSQFFFTQYIKGLSENIVFVIHNPFLDFHPGFQNMKDTNKKVLRIGINHGLGIGGDRMWYEQLNPRIRDTIEKKISPDVEAFICLTKEAVNDFKKRLGGRNIIYCIPNTVIIPESINDYTIRDQNKVIFVGRLSAVKQIDHLIKAWKIVEESVPNAVLEISGEGNEKLNLMKLAEKLCLKKIKFNGYVDDAERHFSLATCSVTCSDFEGFSLSLHESLANGCPVITYDFKYGPNDIIVNGENGFIVPKNDIKKLADNIIHFLKLPMSEKKLMSENARKSVFHLRNEKYENNWMQLYNDVLQKYDSNLYNVSIRSSLIGNNYERDKLQVKMHVEGVIPPSAWGKEQIRIRMYNDNKTDYTELEIKHSSNKIEKCIIADVKSSSIENLSICLIWNNCYYEKMINELDFDNKL